MMFNRQALPDGISHSMLASALSKAIHQVQIDTLSWECERIYEPLVSTTKAVYRLTGSVQQHEQHSWSLILKVLRPRADRELPLEATLYQSGFLAALNDGLIAPQCYGVDRLPDGSTALWLEMVRDSGPLPWSVDDIVPVARHLGTFSAQYNASHPLLIQHPLPSFSLYNLVELWRDNVEQLRAAADHPLVQHAYPRTTIDGFVRLSEAHTSLLDALQADQVLCHGDAQRRNLFITGVPTSVSTTAIDWGNLSLRPIGNDIATLVHQALLYFDLDMSDAAACVQAARVAFREGLNAGGWHATPEEVAFAISAQLALLGLSQIRPFLRMALNSERHAWAEQFYGRPLEAIVERHRVLGGFLIEQSEEVLHIIHH